MTQIISQSRKVTPTAALGLVGVVGLFDYVTGPDISFSIFYLLPIALAAWIVSRRAGIVVSIVSAGVWLAIDLLQSFDDSNLFTHFWNAGVRLGFFLIVSFLLSKWKAATQSLEQQVVERTASLTGEVAVRRRAEEELRRTNRALLALKDCNQQLVRATEESELLRYICRILVNAGGYRLAWVGYAEEDEAKTVRPVASEGYEDGYLDIVNITWADEERGRGPAGTAIRNGQPVCARNIATDPNFAPWRAEALKRGYASSIAVPLMVEGRTLGALNIYATEPEAFDSQEIELLSELADDLAYGIQALRTRAAHLRAEAALEQSARQWQTTFDSMTDLICLLDSESRIVQCNKAMADFLGKSAGEFVGHRCWPLMHGMSEPIKGCPMLVMKQTRHRECAVLPLGDRWFEAVAEPIFSNSGAIVGCVHILSDITERNRAEEQLRSLAARNEALLGSIPDIIMEVDNNKIYRWANPAGFEFFGEDVIGREAEHYFVGEQETYGQVQPLFNGEENTLYVESWQRRRDGEKRLLAWWRRALKDSQGNATGALSTARDITAEKQAGEDLRRLATAVEQAAETILITDVSGRIQYVNPAFERITGHTRAEVIGQNPRLLRSGQHDQEFYRQMWKTILAGEPWHGHFINRKKDGTLYEEEAVISPVRVAAGQITNFVAIKRDVTREAALEAQLRHVQKMEAVGQLAGGVAHDFNNLLTAIMGNTELLSLHLLNDADACQNLEEIRKASHRAATLTRQLLAFSRRQVPQLRVMDINDIVTDMAGMLRRLLGEAIELVVSTEKPLGSVRADRSQIEQVIMNLAVNARDAMAHRGTLAIATANVTIDEDFARRHPVLTPGQYVMLSVSDAGCGMSAEVKAHLFEPFFTTKEQGKGTGLGLATCYGIVENCGGHILVNSEVGRGTTFRIYLPRTGEEAKQVAEEVQALTPTRGSETILVVEDEPSVRELMALILRKNGYKVLEAGNGEDARQVADEVGVRNIQLLLADAVLPAMNGWELAEWLIARHADTKVLFTSGYTGDVRLQNGIREATVAFLEKPFTSASLARKVREVLDS